MKTKKITKKISAKQKLLILLGVVGAALILIVFVLFIFQKKTYITTDLFISGGEWWWMTADPPYWLSNPVIQGAAEYDITGKKIVEILHVEKFDQQNRKLMIVKARLLVTKNLRTKKYRFKQTPLEIGATIAISPGNIEMYANVMGIDGVQDLSPQETETIVARWYNVFPWQADAIHIGDSVKDGSGNEVARIINKEVSIAEKTIVTENNQSLYGTQSNYGTQSKQTGQLILLRSDPLRRDVTLTISLKVRHVDSQKYFGVIQNVKIGEPLYISLPDIFINPIIVSLPPVE